MQEFKKGDKIIYKGHVCYYEGNNGKDIVIQVPYGKFLGHYSRENEFQDPISGYKYYGISEKDISNLQLVKTKVTELGRNEVILCTTEDECNKILDLMHEAGLKWQSGETYKQARYMHYINKGQCYEPSCGQYAYKEYYEEEGYTIYPASDFIQESKVERAYVNVKMQGVLENCTGISNTKVSLIPHKINGGNLGVDPGSYDSHLIYNGEDYGIGNKLKGIQPLANAHINGYLQGGIGNTIGITSNSIVSGNNTGETHIEEETYKPKRLYEIL